MSKRKLLVSLLCVGTVIGLASCGQTETPVETETPVVTPEVTPTPEPTETPVVIKHTITFDTNGGDELAAIEVDPGTLESLPTPTKEGYVFVSWYRNEELTDEFYLDRTIVDRDVTLYAKWEVAKYYLKQYTSLNSNPVTTKVEHGYVINNEPVIPGYKFLGWYLDEELTTPYEDTPITGDLSVYAKLELITYTVTYENNDLGVAPEEVELAALPAELPVLSAEGYNFIGWYTDEACTVEAVAGSAITEDITLYAKWELIKYNITFDANDLGVAPSAIEDVNALPAELPALTELGYKFLGWYTDEALTTAAVAGSKISADTVLYAKWEANKCSVTYDINELGTQPEGLVDVNALPAELPVLTAEGYIFLGWYMDEELTEKAEAGAFISKDTVLYAGWVETEEVTYVLNDTDLPGLGKLAEDFEFGPYLIKADNSNEIRNRERTWTDKDSGETLSFSSSLKMSSKDSFVITVPGNGVLSVWVQNGSSDATQYAMQKIQFGKVGGSFETVEFTGVSGGSPIVRLDFEVEAGCQYIIKRPSGTVDLYRAELKCLVAKSEIEGFDIFNEGVVDYLVGDTLDTSKLIINAVYGSGRTEVIANDDAELVIDSSKVDFTNAGVYQVSVKYRDYEAQTFDVAVYDVTSLELGFNAIEKISNSSAGNGVYFNQTVQRIYVKDAESLDPSYLSVVAIATHPTDNTKTIEFVLSTSEYLLSEFDASTAGEKEISVIYKLNQSVVAKFSVWVVDTAPSIVEEVAQVKVEKDYEGVVGAVVDGYNMFTTIQQALDYLELSDLPSTTKKLLVIGEGLYNEKLEVVVPRLTIKGAGADKTTIEWDSLYGVADEGGFIHTTDSTATFSVREAAEYCTIEDITISNYWNSLERFDKDLGAGYSEHRALAMLIQSDKFIMRNSTLLGYQDTLELFKGRQLFENVRIEGTTDFIFGTNNTTYFKNCTIHSIDSHANAGTKSDGGYITAFKGSNVGANDYVTYGAIFDACIFTADADVLADKNTAIGRTWGAYAAVMVMNSELGAHISKTENKEGNASKNVRYVSMNQINVKDTDTLKFVEYNNTGDGAITASQAGVTVLTDAEAAGKYADYATIFGKTNGKVSYLEAWDPNQTEVEVDDRTYYYFNQASSETGTSYTFDTNTTIASGSTVTFEGLTISAENGKVAWNSNANSLNMKSGAFIKFNVEAGSEVIITAYNSTYNKYSLNGVQSTSNMIVQYYAEATEVTLLSVGDSYLYSITINPNEEAPEAPILDEIKAEGANVNYTVGDEFSLEGLVVKAYYSDNTFVVLDAEDYVVNYDAVNNEAAGSYEVKVTYGAVEVSYTVTFEEANADPAITSNTTLSFKSASDYAAIKNNPRVTMNVTAERDNSGNYQFGGTISFMVKAGTQVIVTPYAQSKYVNYTIGAEGEINLATQNSVYTYVANEDCTVVYTGNNVGNGNYIVSIDIICPVSNETYTFGSENAADGDYTKLTASAGNVTISGNPGDHKDSLQLGENSTISFCVPAYSTISVLGFDTTFGQLKFFTNGTQLEVTQDSKAVYTFEVTVPTSVIITAVNVGTEDDPTYNKSYIKSISVATKEVTSVDTTWSFNTGDTTDKENYYVVKDKANGSIVNAYGLIIDASTGKLEPRENVWSQFTNGAKVQFVVNRACTITVKGYTNGYTVNGVAATGTAQTAQTFEVEAGVVTIASTDGDNYINYISVAYPVELETFEQDTIISMFDFTDTVQGSKVVWNNMNIDATSGKIYPNANAGACLNANTVISFKVAENAVVSLLTYQNSKEYTMVIEDGICTITTTAQIYISNIIISYPVDFTDDATLDLSVFTPQVQKQSVEWKGLSIDATSGKYANNNGGWIQVNSGTVISFTVAEGAIVSVHANSSADNFSIVVEGTTCTITAVGNDFLKSITVQYLFDLTKDITVDLNQCNTTYQGDKGSWKGITIDATNGKFAPNGSWRQVNAGTIISFTVAEGAQVSIVSYGGNEKFDVVVEGTTCTITAIGDDYLSTIIVTYPTE